MTKLAAHDLGAAHQAVDDRLVKDRPQPGPVLAGENLLPGRADFDATVDLIGVELGPGRLTGVVGCLEQAGHHQRLEVADRGGSGLQDGRSIVDRKPSGALMRLVADGLERNGFRVRLPEWRDGRRLAIIGHGARCELSVNDCGGVTLDYSPRTSGEADPKQIADLATMLLTGRQEDYPRRGSGHELRGTTLKGIVGLEVKARGLDVGLQVYEDEDAYDVVAEIVVTNPATEEFASVRVTDDGAILWERDYWPEAATTGEPEYSAEITDPGKVADSIVATVTQAISPSTDVETDAL